jgi:hypothetical protein
MAFLDIFIGTQQSRYAAIAILGAILIVSLTILLGNDPIPLSQKFAFVFMIFIFSLPGLALSLFQLTCMVTGAGFKNKRWWCSGYAWIISILLIVYCILLITMSIFTLTNRSKMLGDMAIADAEKFVAEQSGANKVTNAFLNAVNADAAKQPANPIAPQVQKQGAGASTGTVTAQPNFTASAQTGGAAAFIDYTKSKVNGGSDQPGSFPFDSMPASVSAPAPSTSVPTTPAYGDSVGPEPFDAHMPMVEMFSTTNTKTKKYKDNL